MYIKYAWGELVCLKLSSLNFTISYIMEYGSTPHVGMVRGKKWQPHITHIHEQNHMFRTRL